MPLRESSKTCRFPRVLVIFFVGLLLLTGMEKISPFKALKIINIAKKGVPKAEWKDRFKTLYKSGFRISSGLYSQKTGAFKSKLPDVFEGTTHFKRAKRELKFVKYDENIKNERNKSRKFTAQTIDTLMQGLTKPLTETLNAYKSLFKSLHPFEATVAELTLVAQMKAGGRHIDDILGDVKTLRRATSQIGKEFASKGATATSAMEAKIIHDEGLIALEDLYHQSKLVSCLEELLQVQKDLRRIPVVELDAPTVVLVGAPNVGKSSIVRAVSSGIPEVNDYPFTTRGVSIGHIVDRERYLRFQVMDTPGLLDRPEDQRNEMEKLTFASLLHLPTAVIFVIDPSGLSGEKSSLEAQLNVRKYLRGRFPKRPWLDVVSKADLDFNKDVKERLPEGALYVSTHNGHNIEQLKYGIEHLMGSLRMMLIERGALDKEEVIGELKTNLGM